MTPFWLKLYAVCSTVAIEEARNEFPFLATYPSSDARKWLAAFRSFPPTARVALAPLLVTHQLRHQLSTEGRMTPDEQMLLKQMIVRVEHVPMATLDELADRPRRIISGWDENTSERSHVNPMLRRARKSDVRRSVLKALRESETGGKMEGSTFYTITAKVGNCSVRYQVDFGGIWQMRLDASVKLGTGEELRGITLPISLGYLVIGFDEVMPEHLEIAGRVAVQELAMLDRLIRAALSA